MHPAADGPQCDRHGDHRSRRVPPPRSCQPLPPDRAGARRDGSGSCGEDHRALRGRAAPLIPLGETRGGVRPFAVMGMVADFRSRFLDVLASIYIYNEHRGYTSLDRVLEAVRARCPDDSRFIAAVEKHRADEEKHYRMFRRWFELRGEMPLKVDRTCGHIDHFIQSEFGCPIVELDTGQLVANGDEFEKLCRVIMITVQHGMRKVAVLLKIGTTHV